MQIKERKQGHKGGEEATFSHFLISIRAHWCSVFQLEWAPPSAVEIKLDDWFSLYPHETHTHTISHTHTHTRSHIHTWSCLHTHTHTTPGGAYTGEQLWHTTNKQCSVKLICVYIDSRYTMDLTNENMKTHTHTHVSTRTRTQNMDSVFLSIRLHTQMVLKSVKQKRRQTREYDEKEWH